MQSALGHLARVDLLHGMMIPKKGRVFPFPSLGLFFLADCLKGLLPDLLGIAFAKPTGIPVGFSIAIV